jgi:pimeloyl-ACP methyl ester carboxylesterase
MEFNPNRLDISLVDGDSNSKLGTELGGNMPVAKFAGIAVNYVDSGEGSAIVLLHAGASSGRQWRRVGDYMGGYRLIAPDLIGFGATQAWLGPDDLSHDHQAALVKSVIDQSGVATAHVVGHSYGGATAMRLVLAEPKMVRSLTLIEPITMTLLREAGELALFEQYRGFAQGFIDEAQKGNNDAAWRSFLDARNGTGTWAGLDESARSRFLSSSAQAVAGFISNLDNPTSLTDCCRIATPTAVAYGENTTVPDRRVAEIIADAIPGASLHVIPEAGHMSPLSHPEGVADVIRRHLQTV